MTLQPDAKIQLALAIALLAPVVGVTQQNESQSRDAKAIVAAAVQTELKADREDHSAYMYRDHDITPDHDTLYYTVETPKGNLRRKLEDHGHPLTPDQRQADNAQIMHLLSDKSLQAKQQKDGAHDDQQAEAMLKLLPVAFLWTFAGEEGDLITLDFKPDPRFTPTDAESKVLSAMGGQVVVARNDNRIHIIRGTLLKDVTFGGFLARLRMGGFFNVERREVAPHHWQITDTHIKIQGYALFFKSIGTVEDETRTDFKPSPAENLQQACEIVTVCKPTPAK